MNRRVITKNYPNFDERKSVELYAKLNDEIYDGCKVIKLENGAYLTTPQRKYPPVTEEDIARYEFTLADESLVGDERIEVLEEITGKLLYHFRKTNGA